MQPELSKNQGGFSRLRILAAAAVVALSVCLAAVLTGPASAVTPQQRYDQARQKLDQIAGTVDELRNQVAEDNRRVDALLGELSGLQIRADELTAALEAKQVELDAMEAELEKGRKHLRLVRKRLQRALDTLRDQLVSLYMSGTPDVAEMVLGSTDWSELVTTTGYAESIQNRDEAVIQRVTTLREQIKAAVERMKVQEEKLQAARDAIAVEQQEAVAARDELLAQRADFVATRDMREQRIAALQEQAGTIEGNLPDLSVDPASSSAPAAPAPVSGQTAVLGSDGLAGGSGRRAPGGQGRNRRRQRDHRHALRLGRWPRILRILRLRLLRRGQLRPQRRRADLEPARLDRTHHLGRTRGRQLDHRLRQLRSRLRSDRRHALGHLRHRWNRPKWHTDLRDNVGFIARHPSGL